MDEYVEDRLSGRRIFWCPGGEGFLAYCPQPTDRDDYTYCCLYYYFEKDLPTCCRFPFHTGVIIAFFLASIVAVAVMTFLACWCCPLCPLAKRMMDRKVEAMEGEEELEEFDPNEFKYVR